jgi:hypothetical protein
MSEPNYNNDPQHDRGNIGENPCAFMKLPKCMRQDVSKRLDLTICNACIAGRAEGHLFALREKLVPRDPNRRT